MIAVGFPVFTTHSIRLPIYHHHVDFTHVDSQLITVTVDFPTTFPHTGCVLALPLFEPTYLRFGRAFCVPRCRCLPLIRILRSFVGFVATRYHAVCTAIGYDSTRLRWIPLPFYHHCYHALHLPFRALFVPITVCHGTHLLLLLPLRHTRVPPHVDTLSPAFTSPRRPTILSCSLRYTCPYRAIWFPSTHYAFYHLVPTVTHDYLTLPVIPMMAIHDTRITVTFPTTMFPAVHSAFVDLTFDDSLFISSNSTFVAYNSVTLFDSR